MTLKIGGLFFGYGGLDMAVQEVLGGELAWVSEIDPGACKIIAHHHHDVPNLGDITTVDWTTVEPVDILTGGSPCQDLSHAGKRAGMTEGTRSNLWVAMREGIATLRPRLVIWENVRGAYSACADSDLGRCPRCMGTPGARRHAPVLRALGRVLGDLSDLGYDARWHGLRAADVGAPHGRFRVFVVAHPRGEALEQWSGLRASDSPRIGRGRPLPTPTTRDVKGANQRRDASCLAGALMPTPRATDGSKGGPNQRGSAGDLMLPSAVMLLPTPSAVDGEGGRHNSEGHQKTLPGTVRLLPTPAVNDMGSSYTPDEWDAWTARMKAEHGNGNGHGKSLEIEAQRLLPTPTSVDSKASGGGYNGQTNVTLTDATVRQPDKWGVYGEAVIRWQELFREAPEHTVRDWEGWRAARERRFNSKARIGFRGSLARFTMPPAPRLNPKFSEWMMGLPAGHVTDVPGITRNEALKALGNGVVPQQAVEALRLTLTWQAEAS